MIGSLAERNNPVPMGHVQCLAGHWIPITFQYIRVNFLCPGCVLLQDFLPLILIHVLRSLTAQDG
jgi:hypothetical protein